MMTELPTNEILDNPSEYGSKGQGWDPAFVDYMVEIVAHPTYVGMPDAIKDDGKIQWEAPSNRKSGKYRDTHHRRRDWWRNKARSIGIDPESHNWISRTAKRIHPTGLKPCKRCGTVLRLAYAHTNKRLERRLRKTFGDSFELIRLEPLPDLVERLVDTYGDDVLHRLPGLLKTPAITPPDLGASIDDWLFWIENEYIPAEPSQLSPGAYSNAPDRLDGFHSFNSCCRSTADKGRHDTNMRSYTTDRRVFEHWSEGDWIAADRLMGLVRARYRDHPPADGGDPPATADHIGPLSLGFMHRPEFRLLSRAANSAKNNRMSKWDVDHLKSSERDGTPVASWHAQPLWDMRKGDVIDEETALRLSKLMRDNHRVAMRLLFRFLQAGRLAFLASLLELDCAAHKFEFIELRISDEHVTQYSGLAVTDRTTKYTEQQQARRLRIALESLRAYGEKENRHMMEIADSRVDDRVARAIASLSEVDDTTRGMDDELQALIGGGTVSSEDALRDAASRAAGLDDPAFKVARSELLEAMRIVATTISAEWDSDRYVRTEFDLDTD